MVNTERIVLGAGCFWCTEASFKLIRGVISTYPGYAGGHTPNPTYEQVCTGDTGHAEVLQVDYDPAVVTLDQLLDVYLTMHDPTSLNKQGSDEGTQYRSIVLYTTLEQEETVRRHLQQAGRNYRRPIVTQIERLKDFYPAEEYHKDYFQRHPNASYCAFVVRPKVEKVEHSLPELLR